MCACGGVWWSAGGGFWWRCLAGNLWFGLFLFFPSPGCTNFGTRGRPVGAVALLWVAAVFGVVLLGCSWECFAAWFFSESEGFVVLWFLLTGAE